MTSVAHISEGRRARARTDAAATDGNHQQQRLNAVDGSAERGGEEQTGQQRRLGIAAAVRRFYQKGIFLLQSARQTFITLDTPEMQALDDCIWDYLDNKLDHRTNVSGVQFGVLSKLVMRLILGTNGAEAEVVAVSAPSGAHGETALSDRLMLSKTKGFAETTDRVAATADEGGLAYSRFLRPVFDLLPCHLLSSRPHTTTTTMTTARHDALVGLRDDLGCGYLSE